MWRCGGGVRSGVSKKNKTSFFLFTPTFSLVTSGGSGIFFFTRGCRALLESHNPKVLHFSPDVGPSGRFSSGRQAVHREQKTTGVLVAKSPLLPFKRGGVENHDVFLYSQKFERFGLSPCLPRRRVLNVVKNSCGWQEFWQSSLWPG